jgi:hypothetical protein
MSDSAKIILCHKIFSFPPPQIYDPIHAFSAQLLTLTKKQTNTKNAQKREDKGTAEKRRKSRGKCKKNEIWCGRSKKQKRGTKMIAVSKITKTGD